MHVEKITKSGITTYLINQAQYIQQIIKKRASNVVFGNFFEIKNLNVLLIVSYDEIQKNIDSKHSQTDHLKASIILMSKEEKNINSSKEHSYDRVHKFYSLN